MDGWSIGLGVVGVVIAAVCITILKDPAIIGSSTLPETEIAKYASGASVGMFLVFANPVLIGLWPVPAAGLAVHALLFGVAAWVSMQ
jgi:hypothetical protein